MKLFHVASVVYGIMNVGIHGITVKFDPCSTVDCKNGYACVVEATGRAYCEPTCELNNGGCEIDETCILECIGDNCEKTIKCHVPSPCDTVRCAIGYTCEVDVSSDTGFCNPSCTLNNGGCGRDETCTLVQVECFTAPCPPMIQCV